MDIDVVVRILVRLSGVAAIIWALAPLVKAAGHAVAEVMTAVAEVMTAKAALNLSKAAPPPAFPPEAAGARSEIILAKARPRREAQLDRIEQAST